MFAPPQLLRSLEALGAAHLLDRKRLVAPDVNFGRELLVAMARRTGGWIGWEATNLRGMAQAFAFVPLAERGVSVADDVTINALANTALDRAIAAKRLAPVSRRWRQASASVAPCSTPSSRCGQPA